ncbi:MAG: WD40 repeat domain-containing protein [Planctomycetales bacterium]|nr:WD40 repeat domain-containing protein [Planctomycetales bacterium]
MNIDNQRSARCCRIVSVLLVATQLSSISPIQAEPLAVGEVHKVRQFSHGSHIYQVAFSPDGKLVATNDQVWESETGRKVASLPVHSGDHAPGNFWLAFSPDSRHAAIHRFRDVVLVEAKNGKQVWKVGLPPRAAIRERTPRLAFTADGKMLLSVRNDEKIVRIWDVGNGKEMRHFPFAPDADGQNGADIISFGVADDAQRLVVHYAVSGNNGVPVMLKLATGDELHRYWVSSADAWVQFSSVSPDGNLLAYSRKGAVHLLDLMSGREPLKLESVGQHAFYVSFSPDGTRIAASIRPARETQDWIQCWEWSTGKTICVFKVQAGVTSFTFSPDGKQILAGGSDQKATLWRLPE